MTGVREWIESFNDPSGFDASNASVIAELDAKDADITRLRSELAAAIERAEKAEADLARVTADRGTAESSAAEWQEAANLADDAVRRLQARLATIENLLTRFVEAGEDGILLDCKDNHGKFYQSQFLADTMSSALAELARASLPTGEPQPLSTPGPGEAP